MIFSLFSVCGLFIRHWAGYKRSLGLRLGHAWWWFSKENLVNYCKPCVVWMWNYSRNHMITMPIIYEIFSSDQILTIYWARNTLKKWWEKSEGQNGHPQYEETIRMHVSCGLLPFLSLVFRHVLNMFLGLTWIHLWTPLANISRFRRIVRATPLGSFS